MIINMTWKAAGGFPTIFDKEYEVDGENPYKPTARIVYDWIYSFLLIVVFVEIISGLIIDTFG